jgi:hypothetical protein
MGSPFHRHLRRFLALMMVIILSGAPMLATAQNATPDASPEAVIEPGYQVIKSSVTSIEPPAAGAVELLVFHTELLIEPGGSVPAEVPHYGTVTTFVQSGSICYTLEDAPAATVSFLTIGSLNSEQAPSTIDCGVEHESCEAICGVTSGESILLQAGDSITHIVPSDSGGLTHTFFNPDIVPAWVVDIEISPVMFARSCHGGCPP